MRLNRWASYAVLALGHISRVTGTYNCPIPGAQLPPPQHLVEHPVWIDTMKRLSTSLDDWVANAKNWSFAIQVFSTNPGNEVIYERYHTAPNLPSNTTGVKKVDENTVFRLGSITKVYTVLALLAKTGNKYFNDPITKFIPELANLQANRKSTEVDDIRTINWDEVTIWTLAAQLSGIASNYGVIGEITQFMEQNIAADSGFPPLAASDIPPCGAWPLCNRTEFFNGVSTLYPSFAPWTTPAYSNIAYQLLAYALENVTGETFNVTLNNTVLLPLGLDHTFSWYANESYGIIPGNVNQSGWNIFLGEGNPGGGMFSSAKDLSTLGRAILNSTLLKPVLTRQWLNPSSFPADFVSSVGAPWGIRRVRLSDSNPDQSVMVFSKAGSLKKYGGVITLIPDFKIGFTILTAGDSPSAVGFPLADILGYHMLPAYQIVRLDEANKRFGGTYRAVNQTTAFNGSVIALNSSLTLTADLDRPGLGVQSWWSNNTNMITTSLALQTGFVNDSAVASVRIYFTGLETLKANGNRRLAFKAVFEDIGLPTIPGTGFTTDCGNWIAYAGVTYGSFALDEFIFEVSPKNEVLSVENPGLRVTLSKVS